LGIWNAKEITGECFNITSTNYNKNKKESSTLDSYVDWQALANIPLSDEYQNIVNKIKDRVKTESNTHISESK
jgi:hypothetical protein